MDNVHERMLINFINKDLSPAVDEMLQTHKLSKLQDYYCEFRLEKERGKYIVNEVELIEKILELE